MSIKHFSDLSLQEKDLLLTAPALVTALIAGADQNIDKKEKDWAAKLVHYRTFTTDARLLHDYYEVVSPRFEADLNGLVESWNPDSSPAQITESLSSLNDILSKIDAEYADLLKDSWRSLAKKIAAASGGLLGFGSINAAELKVIDLEMIK